MKREHNCNFAELKKKACEIDSKKYKVMLKENDFEINDCKQKKDKDLM